MKTPMPDTLKSAFVIVKDGIEKTAKEWVEHLKDQTNHMGREYNTSMFNDYARKKIHGFSYKEYPDINGEVWKRIKDSDNKTSYWEISNMNRVKYITKHAENVLSGDRLGLSNCGYPVVRINGKPWGCHILSFMTFFPEEYASKKNGEMILHEDDNKMDFRPYKLRVGTATDNINDAHDNGKHDGKKTSKMRCASYIDGVFEKEHLGQRDAVRYLISKGVDITSHSKISQALKAYNVGRVIVRYGRTWKPVVVFK